MDLGKKVVVDMDKSLRMHNAIKNGHFQLTKEEPLISNKSFRPHSSRSSVAGNLSEMLLSPKKLRNFQECARRKVLTPAHRLAWTRHWWKLQQREDQLLRQLTNAPNLWYQEAVANCYDTELVQVLQCILLAKKEFMDQASQCLASTDAFGKENLLKLSQDSDGTEMNFAATKSEALTIQLDLMQESLASGSKDCLSNGVMADLRLSTNSTCYWPDGSVNALLQNIRGYYSDKLARIRAKSDQLDKRRPTNASAKLFLHLKDVYSDNANSRELMEDMFARVTNESGEKSDDDGMLAAKQIGRWLECSGHIKQQLRACILDLRNEVAQVVAWAGKQAVLEEDIQKKKEDFHEQRVKQEERCLHLHDTLGTLREKRLEMELKEAEQMRLQRQRESARKKANDIKVQERRSRVKQMLLVHHQTQAQLDAERKVRLEEELQSELRRRRGLSLQRVTRINLRRVMRQNKLEVAAEAERAKLDEELSKEARLESLRRQGRSRLLRPCDEAVSTVTKETAAWAAKLSGGLRREALLQNVPLASVPHGYSDDEVLADARRTVAELLRAEGLLAKGREYAMEMLLEVEPPTRPRKDMQSQIMLGKEENVEEAN